MHILKQPLPGLRLSELAYVSKVLEPIRGNQVLEVQRDLARRMAEAILRERALFSVTEVAAKVVVELRLDARVLSTEELRKALIAHYEAGVRDGRGLYGIDPYAPLTSAERDRPL